MTDERWQMLVERAKKDFEDVSISTEDMLSETPDGLVKQGTQDIMEFTTDAGSFRIVRENKPVVLDKKQHFSHRQGDSARTEYVFSETEMSHRARFFRMDRSGEWQEINPEDAVSFLA